MNAIPPSRNSSSHTSTAATTQRRKPVSEMAFGVSRDSIRRLRISAWYSRPRVGRGPRSTGGVVIAPRLWQRGLPGPDRRPGTREDAVGADRRDEGHHRAEEAVDPPVVGG